MRTRLITVRLRETELEALLSDATNDYRHPREQAHFLIREGLVRRGLLPAESERAPVTAKETSDGGTR